MKVRSNCELRSDVRDFDKISSDEVFVDAVFNDVWKKKCSYKMFLQNHQ